MKPIGRSINSELVSACSALNTEVTYQGPLKTADDEFIFISEAEPLAKHSIEHIYSAINIASKGIGPKLWELGTYIDTLNLSRNEFRNINTLLRDIEQQL